MHLELSSISAGIPLPAVEPIVHRRSRCSLGFALFLVLNGVLFIRPAEIVPALIGLPIYEVVIGTCLLASLPAIAERLAWNSLSKNLALPCTLALLPAVILSHLTHGNLYEARIAGETFGKVTLYYLLLVGLIDSWARFRTFLLFILTFVVVTAVLALLQYHGWIDIATLAPYARPSEAVAEAVSEGMLVRLQASGIFNDPNDFSLILVTGILLCCHQILESKGIIRRLWWLSVVPFLAYAFALTRSRGGFLALLAGLLTLTVIRFGWLKGALIAAVVLPILLAIFAGRQTSIDLTDSEDTAQGRILLWRDSLVLFHSDPLRGLGFNMIREESGQPPHNAFVHCFCELGVIGGSLFAGAFYVCIDGIRKRRPAPQEEPPTKAYWRPCILAMVIAYAVGLCSLSRSYVVPTYVILGMSAAYLGLAGTWQVRDIMYVSGKSLRRVAVAGTACLLFFEVFVRIFAG
jgi:putative inorganic carbon (hco3(-)) transporter